MFIHTAVVAPDPDGGFLVTFPDVPEAITHGETMTEALANASEALGLALRGYLLEGRPLPVSKAGGGVPVAVGMADAMKLSVIVAFQEAGISKTELARRLGKAETEARRILDPDHPTKLPMLEQALAAMNKRAVVELVDA